MLTGGPDGRQGRAVLAFWGGAEAPIEFNQSVLTHISPVVPRSRSATPTPTDPIDRMPWGVDVGLNVLLGRIPLRGAEFLPEDLPKRFDRQRRILLAQNPA